MSVYREVMAENGSDLSSCADLERSMWAKIMGEHMPKGNKLPWALVKKNIKVQLPYMPDIINYNSGCRGLKKADGLYIPCGGKCEEETVLCAPCTKIGAKYGTLEDRTSPGTYMDPEDKHEITYGTWLAKKEKTVEEVNTAIQEAGFDFMIPESYLGVNAKRAEAKHRPGRPKAKKEVSESDSESESEPKVKKSKAPKAKKSKSESESDEPKKKAAKKSKSESESDEPKAKKAAKKAAKAESDSESESEPKAKKTKAPKAKKAAKDESDSEETKAPKAKKAAKKSESDSEETKPKKAPKKAKSDEPKAKKAAKKSKESDESGSESDAPKAKKSPKKVVEAAPEQSELQLDAEGFEAEDEDIEIDGMKFKLREGRMVFNMDGEWVACIEEGEVNWRE